MRGFHEARASESRLRVVFEDDQVSFGFPTLATLGDVADWVGASPNSTTVLSSPSMSRCQDALLRQKSPTQRTDISVARFADHAQAEKVVKALAQAGVHLKQMSIVSSVGWV